MLNEKSYCLHMKQAPEESNMSQIEQVKRATHPSGKEIVFTAKDHTYFVDGVRYISATGLIHNFFPQFDSVLVANRKALREGVLAEDLLSAWAASGQEASELGTAVHAMAEKILLSKDLSAADEMAQGPRQQLFLAALKQAIPKILQNYDVVEMEKILFSPKYKVAGTIDLLLKNKKTGKLVVADWKTNKEIKHTAFQNQTGHGPCGSLPDCNFIQYSLQLALYRELLIQENYYPNTEVGCVLIHLCQFDGKVTVRQIDPVDLQIEARAVLATNLP
jgi:ATP-dependent exoDNAse (exonuclease V) beta subunit